jgi:flagellar biosynthesis/type III secretory pathway chaperone
MMDTFQVRFAEILQNELGQLARLELVLGQEHEALKLRDNEILAKNTKEKQELIVSIEALGRSRLELLQSGGKGKDKESLLAFVNAEPQLRSQWDELEAVLLRCQKQNQINGVLLEKGKQQTQQLLGILLGDGNRRETELYDAKGSTTPSFLNGRSVKV